MHSKEYEKLQEQRFSNNTGTTFTEIVLITQLPFVLLGVSIFFCCKNFYDTCELYKTFVIQFSCIFIPHILFLTLLSSHIYYFYGVVFFTSLVAITYHSFKFNIWKALMKALSNVVARDSNLPSITYFRAITNSFSLICILAADFECFPRKYLKTELQGYGLMDTGIGLYIISCALTNSHFTKPISQRQREMVPFMLSVFRKIVPLLVIGIGRIIGTSILSYHNQVTEYGAHWNFFITLAIIALFNEILMLFVYKIKTISILIIILIPLQELLFYIGLKDWINGNSLRTNFISGNREGICSLIGCEILYMCGLVMKHFLPVKGDKYVQCTRVFFSAFIIFASFTKFLEYFFGISRKLFNSGYIFWIICVSLVSLLSSIVLESLIYFLNYVNKSNINEVPLILKAINFNGLAFFLVGNLLTGFINLVIPTLNVEHTIAIVIIIFYMFLCCFLMIYLHQKKMRIR